MVSRLDHINFQAAGRTDIECRLALNLSQIQIESYSIDITNDFLESMHQESAIVCHVDGEGGWAQCCVHSIINSS